MQTQIRVSYPSYYSLNPLEMREVETTHLMKYARAGIKLPIEVHHSVPVRIKIRGTPGIYSARGGCAPHILGVSLIGKTAVSKTVPREGYVGSNPTPPAI